jgi:hypothetical protein
VIDDQNIVALAALRSRLLATSQRPSGPSWLLGGEQKLLLLAARLLMVRQR